MKKVMLILAVWVATVLVVKAQTALADYQKAQSKHKSKRSGLSDLFDDLEKFEQGTTIWSLSIAIRSDVDKHAYNLKNKIPALTLSYERSIGSNIGVGGRMGYNLWEVTDTKCQVHYYALSARGSYHLNISDNFDPYLGVALTARGATTVDENSSMTKIKPGVSSFIGARYYFKEKLAIFGEIGADMMGWFHVGLNLKI
jgi:Outer membrane protein beta-barrel domain